jgi:hypothetical protein
VSGRLRSVFQRVLSGPYAPELFLALMVAATLATVAFPLFGPLHRGALWGVVLLASFAGWGSGVARVAFPTQEPDLGLRLSWGMAAVVTVGGIACMVSLAYRSLLLVLVLAGIVFEYRYLRDRRARAAAPRAPTPSRPIGTTIALVVVAILAGVQYYAGAGGERLTLDDFQSYLIFPQRILSTGTLIEPFSMRRLAAYGGQSLMQALTLIGSGSVLQIPLFDMGICLVAVLALVIGDRHRQRVGLWLLPVALVLTLPNIRYSSTSVLSGTVFFLALFRTASWPAVAAAPPRRAAAVLGMLAAAASTLRQSYIVPAAVFLAILYTPALFRALRSSGADRWRRLADVAAAPAAMFVCLLPWAVVSYRSSATFLFPLLHGNYRTDYGPLVSDSHYIDRGAFLWVNILHCHPIVTLPLFLLAAVLIPWRSTRGALTALTGASVLGFVALVLSFPLSDEFSMARYYSGFVVATALASALYASSLPWADWRRDRFRYGVAALIIVASVWQIIRVAQTSGYHYVSSYAHIRAAARTPSSLAEEDQPYRLLQARTPVGAPLMAMLDRPYRLDFRRNDIDVIDLPGYVSPPPGMPVEDDEALVDYLTTLGVRYLAVVRSTESESAYLRRGWERMSQDHSVWQNAPVYILKAFDRFDSLAMSRVRLYDDGKMVLLDLAAPVDHAPAATVPSPTPGEQHPGDASGKPAGPP